MRTLAIACIALLCLTSTLTPARADSSNLEKLSTASLRKCLQKQGSCKGTDEITVAEELASRLPSMSTAELVACFGNWRICGTAESTASGWQLSDELARRRNLRRLLLLFWKERSPAIRTGIEHVAYHFDTPEVTTFMKEVLRRRIDDQEGRYWPVNYLAKKCYPPALKELARGRYRNVGCLQYQTSVELFGRCKYRAAVPYLVDDALQDICVNIIVSAEESLHRLYPKSPSDFSSLETLQSYYCSAAKKEGFHVKCTEGKK